MAVLLALYLLEINGDAKPERKKVLRFIKNRNLVTFKEGDLDPVGNGEEKWMNDLSWAREDVKESGLVAMPEYGRWQLTARGREKLLERAKKWAELYEKDRAEAETLISHCQRLNQNYLAHMVCLGRGINIAKISSVKL